MQLRAMLTLATALGTQSQNPAVEYNQIAILGKVVNGFVSMLLANLILRVAVQFSKILGQQLVGVIRAARATVMIWAARATVMIRAARATVVARVVVHLHVRTPLAKLLVTTTIITANGTCK